MVGATVLNHLALLYTAVLKHLLLYWILQNPDGQVVGATVRDTLSGKQHTVYARTIINAAGPFSDEVRALSQVIRRCIVLLSAVLCCAAHGMSWHGLCRIYLGQTYPTRGQPAQC